MSAPRLSGLFVYPLKSGRGTPRQRAALEARGLRDDRRWMVVRPAGGFVTQRELPGLARIEAAPSDGGLQLTASGRRLDVHRPTDAPCEVVVWGETVAAVDAGPDAAGWLTERLGEPVRLVWFPPDGRRQVDLRFAREGDQVAFADGFPLLLIGQASLDDLNARLDEPVGMERFRPNLVVDGAEPFAEDRWRRIRIGGVELEVVKPCARCVMTTVDPARGVVAGKEPLRTLATYRKVGSNVMFGQNVVHRGLGTLEVGAPVEVLATT